MDRVILHCDLNNFYASVECMLNPDISKFLVVVCGRIEDRSGIVLAKNDIAKKLGIKTGDNIYNIEKKSSEIIKVLPHFDQYLKYSKIVKEIYSRFTDLVEPYGIDECWLDVTGSQLLFGTPYEIAYKIKETIKEETGLRISVGVGDNKIFAKMGSDMKKPDAITVINSVNYKDKIWNLPIGDMFGIGKATVKKLNAIGIYKIKEVAELSEVDCKKIMGKSGVVLRENILGLDKTPVNHFKYADEIKSIGHGRTLKQDITSYKEAHKVFLSLSEDISTKMRKSKTVACTVQITIKDNTLVSKDYQKTLSTPVRTSRELADAAQNIFEEKHLWENNVRAITISVKNFVSEEDAYEINLFDDGSKRKELEGIEAKIDLIRDKYGKTALKRCVLIDELK